MTGIKQNGDAHHGLYSSTLNRRWITGDNQGERPSEVGQVRQAVKQYFQRSSLFPILELLYLLSHRP
jgi:hypothetical protein